MEAALTGHMVYTTLHANDAATAVSRLLEMGCPVSLAPQLLVFYLRGLCEESALLCSKKIASAPENELLKSIRLMSMLKRM